MGRRVDVEYDGSTPLKPEKRTKGISKFMELILVGAAAIGVVTLVLLLVLNRFHGGGHTHDPEWYRKTIIYQVYPWSFQDSDGNGEGDLPGITRRLEHFKDIGVGAVWLSPIYTSPMRDMGYDVANFTNVDDMFGGLEAFDELSQRAKDLDLRLIMDLVPNHSSNESRWFQWSRQRIEPYTNFYVWHPGNASRQITVNGQKRNDVPNNWVSVFSGSAWEWDEMR